MNLLRLFRNSLSFFIIFFLSICVFSQSSEESQSENSLVDPSIGKEIFNSQCVSCHYKTEKRLIGPGLAGVTEKRSSEWLKKWITNNKELRESGDKDAIAIFEEYNGSIMSAFDFSDDELNSLLSYLAQENPKESSAQEQILNSDYQKGGWDTNSILILISIVLLIIVFLLVSVKNKLKEAVDEPIESVLQSVNIFINIPANRAVIFFLLVVGSLQFVYKSLMGVGVVEQYQPSQPIEFSHEIHAGDNGIDCNYCHSTARHSQHASVPSANVCMNCHTYIQEGSSGNTEEIQKIYDAVGFDPITQKYIDGYNQKPIEWIKVHNLPDLSYFNHSQHVSVAGLECEQCHGDIKTKTVAQVATSEELNLIQANKDQGIEFTHPVLTMGFCVDCHRQKEIDMESNDYYKEMHENLKIKYPDEKITPAMMGGLECGKCHY